MRLEVKNIGNIRDASINLNGITVVGGENGTGKSTLCRALYSVLSGISVDKKKVESYRSDRLSNTILNYVLFYFSETELAVKFQKMIPEAIKNTGITVKREL